MYGGGIFGTNCVLFKFSDCHLFFKILQKRCKDCPKYDKIESTYTARGSDYPKNQFYFCAGSVWSKHLNCPLFLSVTLFMSTGNIFIGISILLHFPHLRTMNEACAATYMSLNIHKICKRDSTVLTQKWPRWNEFIWLTEEPQRRHVKIDIWRIQSQRIEI